MAFRNYKEVKSKCIERYCPTDLDLAIDNIQTGYDIIDLQFSTHYDKKQDSSKYCALLLIAKKESK